MNYRSLKLNRQKGWVLGAILLVYPSLVQGGVIELSGSFSYSASTFGTSSLETRRSWEASLGYYFYDLTEVEVSAEDILDHTVLVS
jgi:hypothetical protein